MISKGFTTCALACFLFFAFAGSPLYGQGQKIKPKEYGVYVKSGTSLTRIMPNIVFEENGVLFVEGNNPQQFVLKDIESFVLYGKYDIKLLTLNPLLFLQASPLGKPRFILGRDVAITIENAGKDLYTVKPKKLMGRGYFCLWIEDTVWDFIIE